jgi:CheY-like chemotaxis protein
MEEGKRHTVIVVDDDPGSARAIGGLFERAGAEVIVSVDPVSAVELALEPDVALVSLDLSMPHLDGFDVLSLIRSHEQTRSLPSVPVVMVTGAASAEDRAKSIAGGFIAHLTKPVDFDAIAGALRKALYLRAPLYRSRYSPDQDAIVRGIKSMVGVDRRHIRDAVTSLAAAVESKGDQLIYEMALGLYRGERNVTMAAAERLARVAETVWARHLADLGCAIANNPTGAVETLEEHLVRAKAEVDRVVFTLREEAIGRLFG